MVELWQPEIAGLEPRQVFRQQHHKREDDRSIQAGRPRAELRLLFGPLPQILSRRANQKRTMIAGEKSEMLLSGANLQLRLLRQVPGSIVAAAMLLLSSRSSSGVRQR